MYRGHCTFIISCANTPPTIAHTGLNSEKQCLEKETYLADENSGSDKLPHCQVHTRELEVSASMQVLHCLDWLILGEFFCNDVR